MSDTALDHHSGLFAQIGHMLASIGSAFRFGMVQMQQARMIRALNELPDNQLERIGINRSDIPGYAAKLTGS